MGLESPFVEGSGVGMDEDHPVPRLPSLVDGNGQERRRRVEVRPEEGVLAHVDVPTLVLHGTADGIVPFEVSGERTDKLVSNSKLVTVEGGPHGINVSHPDEVNRALPAGREVHDIIDNYATHKHAKVCAWLARHTSWTFHFTPTSSSWLNAVEGFFAKLTRLRLKRGVFHSVADLQAAINRFVAEHNQNPTPFKWKANPNEIIAAAKRGHQTLESIH